jgi:hypothetical protein
MCTPSLKLYFVFKLELAVAPENPFNAFESGLNQPARCAVIRSQNLAWLTPLARLPIFQNLG